MQSVKTITRAEFLDKLSMELRPVAIRSQLFGIISWFCAYIIKPAYSTPSFSLCAIAISIAFAGFYITFKSTHHSAFSFGGTVQICGLAWAFRILKHTAVTPEFWIMQTYVCIVLIKAVMFVSTRAHILSCILVGAILGVGSFNEELLYEETLWLAFGFISPFFFSVLLNRAFLALRLKNMELHASVEEMAFVDQLTAIGNRRSFLGKVTRGHAEGVSGYFFMIDIDDFKKINDDFGHDVGDDVLRNVASALNKCPYTDYVGRLGGEEFGAFAARGSRAEAESCARWMVSEVHSLVHSGRKLSISIGVSRITPSDMTGSIRP